MHPQINIYITVVYVYTNDGVKMKTLSLAFFFFLKNCMHARPVDSDVTLYRNPTRLRALGPVVHWLFWLSSTCACLQIKCAMTITLHFHKIMFLLCLTDKTKPVLFIKNLHFANCFQRFS